MTIPLKTPPKHVCVMRLSAIGDVCHTLPVVRTLQAHWPDTRVTWVIGKTEAGLIGDIPGIEFIIFDKRQGLGAYRELRRAMCGRCFDLLLHMQVALRASLASLLVPADIRLGFDKARARDFQWLFTNTRIAGRSEQHVMDGLFGFVETLGINERRLVWDIPVPDSARDFARRQAAGAARTLVISPCSSQRARNFRNWRAENYAAVADHAAQTHGMRVILTGGNSRLEREYGETIVKLARHKPVNLIGKTDLKQLFALLQQAACVICPDSGPAHMATAAGTPVIGLYATSNPLRTGPYFSQRWVINKYPETLHAEMGKLVQDARWGARVRSSHAMEFISVNDVTTKLGELLGLST